MTYMLLTQNLEWTLFAVMLNMKVGKKFMVENTSLQHTSLIDMVMGHLLVDVSIRIPKRGEIKKRRKEGRRRPSRSRLWHDVFLFFLHLLHL